MSEDEEGFIKGC